MQRYGAGIPSLQVEVRDLELSAERHDLILRGNFGLLLEYGAREYCVSRPLGFFGPW